MLARKKQVCKHFQAGHCSRGKQCPFVHTDRRDDTKNSVLATMLKLVFEKQQSTIFPQPAADATVAAGAVASTKMISLTNLAACPDLANVKASIDFNTMAFCEALCQVVKQNCPQPPELWCIDDNDIVSLHHMTKALERFGLSHTVRGFCARRNRIDSLDVVKQCKVFQNIVELQLEGNPVCERPEYRNTVRKGLPDLLGLDGAGVNRPALNLPWAVPSAHTEQAQQLLVNLETSLFKALAESGPDGCVQLYHVDSVFSLTLSQEAVLKAPTVPSGFKRRNEVVQDFVRLRIAQTDRDANAKAGKKVVTAARGRTDVGSALRHTLYPKSMTVSHELSSNADVQIISTGINIDQIAVVTFHGRMSWQHSAGPEVPPVSRFFDRTLAVAIAADSGQIFITNDEVFLRPDGLDPVWLPNSTSRVQLLARKFSLHEAVVQAILSWPECSDEPKLELALGALRQIGLSYDDFGSLLLACGGQDPAHVGGAMAVVFFCAQNAVSLAVGLPAMLQSSMDPTTAAAQLGQVVPVAMPPAPLVGAPAAPQFFLQ